MTYRVRSNNPIQTRNTFSPMEDELSSSEEQTSPEENVQDNIGRNHKQTPRIKKSSTNKLPSMDPSSIDEDYNIKIYIGRAHYNATVNQVLEELNDIGIDRKTCSVQRHLKKNNETSFVVTLPKSKERDVYKHSWGHGINVCPFREQRHRTQTSYQSSRQGREFNQYYQEPLPRRRGNSHVPYPTPSHWAYDGEPRSNQWRWDYGPNIYTRRYERNFTY